MPPAARYRCEGAQSRPCCLTVSTTLSQLPSSILQKLTLLLFVASLPPPPFFPLPAFLPPSLSSRLPRTSKLGYSVELRVVNLHMSPSHQLQRLCLPREEQFSSLASIMLWCVFLDQVDPSRRLRPDFTAGKAASDIHSQENSNGMGRASNLSPDSRDFGCTGIRRSAVSTASSAGQAMSADLPIVSMP